MKKYIWLLAIGLFFSFSLCFTIIPDCPHWVVVLINITAMLGSGLVCSATVSWIVEHNNERREKENINRQRIYALTAIMNRTRYAISNEIRNLSAFFLVCEEKKKKVRKGSASIEECANILHNMLLRVNSIMKTDYKPSPLKERLLFSDIVPVYQSLNRSLLTFLSDSPVYFVNGVLDEEGIDKLQSMQSHLNEIISLSYSNNAEEAIEAKLNLAEEILTILSALYIDVKQEMTYFINEEIGAVEINE